MLERVALHQTRFRTPGVSPDARGVILGEKGLLLFPSLDRLVAFFCAYSDQSSLDELIPSLEMRQVETPLKTREVVLMLHAESSYRMDRIAAVARLASGLVFTGTQRHFVKYRDASSPLGFDLVELLSDSADLILYHDTFKQTYSFDRALLLRDLVWRLSPQRLTRRGEPEGGHVQVVAPRGVGQAMITYLFRWQITAQVSLVERAAASAFDEGAEEVFVFDIPDAPVRVVSLFDSLPGVHVFAPVTEHVGVELGYRHPIALESCTNLFPEPGLTLFPAEGLPLSVAPLPPFAPVSALVRARLGGEGQRDGAKNAARAPRAEVPAPLELELRLAPSLEPATRVIAARIPREAGPILKRLLYVLPARALESLELAVSDDAFYLLDPHGIEGVPLGTYYCAVARRIYVPSGFSLVPSVAPEVVEALVESRGDAHVFFEPEESAPRVVAAEAFGPVSRRALRDLSPELVHADRPSDVDPPLPMLRYGKPRRFPLFGLPSAPEERSEGEDGP